MEQAEFEHISVDVRQHVDAVCRKYGIGADESEDVAQDVMLKLWALRDDLGKSNSINGFAIVMARNIVLDHLRNKRTMVSVDTQWQLVDDRKPTPDTALEHNENYEWLERKMRQLPSNEYQVLKMRQVEQKSDEDIASILRISVNSIPTLLSRARTKLFKEFQKRYKK